MTSTSPLRHGNQRASVSARPTGAAARAVRGRPRRALRRAHGRRATWRTCAVFLAWLDERGIELVDVRSATSGLPGATSVALRKKDGKPYSRGPSQTRLVGSRASSASSTGGVSAPRPGGGLELPRPRAALPRVVLTEQEARRLIEAPTREARGPSGPGDPRDALRHGDPRRELANLTLYDVDTEERRAEGRARQGRKDRNVPLTRAAAEAIEAYLLKARAAAARAPGKRTLLFLAGPGGKLHRGDVRGSSAAGRRRRGSRSTSPATPSATVWRRTCSRAGPTSGTSRRSWATRSLETTQRYTRVEVSGPQAGGGPCAPARTLRSRRLLAGAATPPPTCSNEPF